MLDSQETAVKEHTLEIINSNQATQHWALGGHSRGGALASHYAVNYPDTFSELVLELFPNKFVSKIGR